MINVLVNAYAVNPYWGSEQGMGWNWVVNIAKYCNTFVITEGEFADNISKAMETLPQKDNLHFYYNPLPDHVRQMCWNQGDWRFYWYYRKWQKRTLKMAKEIIADHHIDVLHQLNMIGFREPGYLWKIKELPLVWGPIGGIGGLPTAYLRGAGWKYNIFFRLKNLISDLQLRFHPRVRAAARRATMIAATGEAQRMMKKVYGKDIPLINETGLYLEEEKRPAEKPKADEKLSVLWVGKFDFRKRLDIALMSVAATNNPDIVLTVCGTGSEEEVTKYHRMAEELGISRQIQWLGRVEHGRIETLMKQADCFLFTSVDEATSTVILEAIAVGLPILSFNACGFGPIVKDFAGKAIELSTPEQSVQDFADALNCFATHRNDLSEITTSQKVHRHTLTWEHKGQTVSAVYASLSNYVRGGVNAWIRIDCETAKKRILWVGKFDFRKQLGLALRVIAVLPCRKDVEFHVVGIGSDADIAAYHHLANDLGIGDIVAWHGAIPHAEVLSLMRKCDLFLFTSISEGTPHVVLEAIQNSLPVVCFNTCGQAETVNESIGVKVELSTPEQSIRDFANAIENIISHEKLFQALRHNCRLRQQELSWDNKARQMVDIYKNIRHGND